MMILSQKDSIAFSIMNIGAGDLAKTIPGEGYLMTIYNLLQ